MALVALQAAGWGLAALAVSRRARWPWALAPALAVSEWARNRWPLGGYPLSQLWLTPADGPLAALGPLVGPFGVTAAVVLAGAALVGMSGRRRAALSTAVVLATVVGAAGLVPPPGRVSEVEAAAVQGGDRREIRLRSDPAPLLRRQFELTQSSDATWTWWSGPRAPWPSAVRCHARTSSGCRSSPRSSTACSSPASSSASTAASDPGWFRNAAVAIDGTGPVDRYDKQLAVPFGERVPLRRILDPIVDLSLVPRDMASGSGPPVLRTELADIGVAISYENLFPRIAREAVAHGAELLVVPTLASSYVTDEIPTQQLAAARMRARETGRDLAIVGSTGPTALVRADGSVAARAPLDVPRAIVATLHRRDATTPAARLGSAPILTLSAIAMAAGASDIRRWRSLLPRRPGGRRGG